MPAEMRHALQPTLEEQAWFARLATVALDAHSAQDMCDGSSHFA